MKKRKHLTKPKQNDIIDVKTKYPDRRSKMNKEWCKTVIKEVALAIYVPKGAGKHIHTNRPYHGLVLNDNDSVKDYVFSDGRVMRTGGGELFYLPRGSVKTVSGEGGCYAINFDAEITARPFSLLPKDGARLRKAFMEACECWKSGADVRYPYAMRALYEAIGMIAQAKDAEYMPTKKEELIAPALVRLKEDITDPALSVELLSELCGLSEVYFRRIFLHKIGLSPKEYIIKGRMQRAAELLRAGELEVSEIATLCGYAEPCHFSREFKRYYGVSPSKYK